MDKNAIKKFAVWARRELIDRVTKRAAVYGITKDSIGDYNAESVNGHLLSGAEKRQRQALIRRIEEKGYEQVMEEVAYTWFNRFAALRFMEVNGYLPSHIRVFTDEEGRFKPQILSEAIHLELDGLDMEKVYQLKDTNEEEDLFKYLLVVQCNALNRILPGMFQKIEDYTELLLPNYLLREGSVIEQMVTLIPEDDWKDQVQIIGWLYQYYNVEPKDKVFADLKKNIKISKESIPAATQLFTPDWIVHYMVENSLGRLWLEGHPNDELKSSWKYYLDEAEQDLAVQRQLQEVRNQYAALKPEELLTIDPCAGSGHILCVLFDVLVQIYEDYGYTAREAATSIVQNNLWGLDIDDRAAQLSYFTVIMKARQYDRRFFTKDVQPHVYTIQESNAINRGQLAYLGHGLSDIERNNAINQMNALLDEFIDAKEYGSLLQPQKYDWELLERFVEDTTPMQQLSFEETGLEITQAQLRWILKQGQALSQKYHIAVTNPPYMAAPNMDDKLSQHLKNHYPDSKSDLFASFIERICCFTQNNYYQAMITQHSWMFLSSFEKLRTKMQTIDLVNMIHLGARAFEEIGGEVVQTTAFVLRLSKTNRYKGTYVRLIDPVSQRGKEEMFLRGENRYTAIQSDFLKIPGTPVAYWVSERMFATFESGTPLSEIAKGKSGQNTGDNERFLRLWYEIPCSEIGFTLPSDYKGYGYRWIPYNKGGEFRRWYGNYLYVVNWNNDGEEIKQYAVIRNNGKHWSRYIQNIDCLYKEGITWSIVTASTFSMRYLPAGFICDYAGCAVFPPHCLNSFLLALFNTKYANIILNIINPTINYQPGNISTVPVIRDEKYTDEIERLVDECKSISKDDWDAFETSWNFLYHPLVKLAKDKNYSRIVDCWQDWENLCNERFMKLKANEENLNRIFINIYDLKNEINPEIDDKEVTVRKADLSRDIRSLISYAVGCMLGRYSLDKPGVIFSGGIWDASQYITYHADHDGILPITDDEYFSDDIVSLFVDWVKAVYGEFTLEENLAFIANAINVNGAPRDVIRNYFLNDFYKDHLKIYQKRPIYWLFDSGKKNGFKALIYVHRYQPDTIARIRTDYVHEMQSRYRTAIADAEQRIIGASTSERVKISKTLSLLQDQADEIRIYEEKIHHLADQMIAININEGVKHNYEIFKDVLAKNK